MGYVDFVDGKAKPVTPNTSFLLKEIDPLQKKYLTSFLKMQNFITGFMKILQKTLI